MNKVIILRNSEIYLKGKNRIYFENKLIANIKNKLDGFKLNFKFNRSRYYITDYNIMDENNIVESLKTVFGIQSLSLGYVTNADINDIAALSIECSPKFGTFRVNTNRADKTFPLNSIKVCEEIGFRMLESNSNLKVDLHQPNFTVNIDIREDKTALVYSNKIICLGGMPVGTAGKGLLMLSGGLDSPVAGFMMAKRGLVLDALHFHSYPYTSELAKQKVIELKNQMENYCGKINLICVSTTRFQELVHEKCEASYMITLLRRFMMAVAERVAFRRGGACLVNGESLGQVASQTLASINVTNAVVKELPIFRPLIGMNKQEIIDIALKIKTYDISIRPYEDCCTVFLPDNPATKPNIEKVLAEESKLDNYQELLNEAVSNLEII